jgi:hypothetical protein
MSGMKLVADLIWRKRPPLPLSPRDDDARRGDSRDSGQPEDLPPLHPLTVAPSQQGRRRATRPAAQMDDPTRSSQERETVDVRQPSIGLSLDEAVELTRTGDLWLFRGNSLADRAIRATTNSPVNHVGMAVVLDDLPPLMWHAELGQSLVDMWSGTHHRGVQLHDLHDAAMVWANRYGQDCWLRQLDRPVSPRAEDSLLRTIARLDGTPFPTTPRLAAGWLGGRLPRRTTKQTERETAYCAEVVALSYRDMGLLPSTRPASWYDPGRFWSGDDLALQGSFTLSGEIPVAIPSPTS